jgi:hypothetical protein
MSFLSGIGDAIGGAVKGIVHTAEDVVGAGLKVGEGVLHAGIDTVGDLVKNPLELLNPFAVLSDAGHNLIKDVAGEFCPSHAATVAGQAASGGGIGEVNNALGGLGNKINSLMDQLTKLDPNSPTYQADVAKLNLQLQQTQQQFTQLFTMASDLLKKADDNVETALRNLV